MLIAQKGKGDVRKAVFCALALGKLCEKGFAKTLSTRMRVFLFTNIPFSVHSDLSSAHKEVCRSLKTEL